MVILKDIAEDLGVSIAAVSYVYNNKWRECRISEDLAGRIKKKLKEENYRPNILGRQLKTKKTQTIGLIFGDLTRNFNANILAGVEKILAPADYFTLVCNSRLGLVEKEHLETLFTRNVEGIILSPNAPPKILGLVREITEEGIPIVFVDNYIPQLKTDFVVSDNYWGAYKAAEFLINKGCRKIAYVGFKKSLSALEERFQGYSSALKDNGLSVSEKLITRDTKGPESVYPALESVFVQEIPDAIFTESLVYFKEGFRFLAERGLSIPDDIALTGFDSVDLSLNEVNTMHFHSLIKQPIPFVEQKGIEMGELAAQILIDRIAGVNGEISQIFLKPHLQFSEKELLHGS